ncbi:MAG: radical SAM protein [bacterium]|nr:radical SAM protein [bacterium]
MRYFLHTYGCQMNDHDSEVLAGFLETLGYGEADSEENADMIVLNTCCIRDHAEQRVYGKLGELSRLKQSNPSLIIAVCGCMTQQTGIPSKLQVKYPHLDLIFGTHNLTHFPQLFQQFHDSKQPVVEVLPIASAVIEDLPRKRGSTLKAWVTIMFGCNNYCTYCIVPYVRGHERSRLPHQIVAEVRGLAQKGYKEITLLGQNVNSYGKDLQCHTDFADLL